MSSIVIKGSKTRNMSYSFTYIQGREGLRQKWNIHLESETGSGMIFAKGQVELPHLPIWKISELRNSAINYHYSNTIGWGSTCEDSTIKITGNSEVSEKQKTLSRTSPEAKELLKLSERSTPVISLSKLAEKVREQASMLDHINFHVEYNNVGQSLFKLNQKVIDMMKGVWWTYLSKAEGTGPIPGPNGSSNLKIQFHSERETFDVQLSNDAETVMWKDIRMTYPYTYLLPKVAGKSIVKSGIESVLGQSGCPTCKFEGDWLKGFNNATTHVEMDDCFHLLSADCGNQKDFGVLVRSMEKQNPKDSPKEMMVFLKDKVEILLTPSERHSKYSSSIRVQINKREVEIRETGKFYPIKDVHGTPVAEIKR